jgi:hypothetical protein
MVAAPLAARTDRLPLDDDAAARRLEQAARILEAQDANIYREAACARHFLSLFED